MAKRYQPSELIGEQGGVQTFAGRDAVNGLPVRLYSFMGEPTSREGELRSDFIPPVLSTTFTGTAGEVVSAFSGEFRRLKGAVEPKQVEALLRETAAALDDAARAGVIHGDLSPERVFFDREAGASGRFVLEGYGVPWPVRPSEFSAPERIGGASFAGDIFSWARTVKHLSGPLPGDLRDLLDRCLSANPAERPHAREVRAALERYPFSSAAPRPNRQAHRDTSAFESFAKDYNDDYGEDYADDPDAQNSLRSDLALPPKTLKLEEYRRQQKLTPSPENAAAQPTAKAPDPASTGVEVVTAQTAAPDTNDIVRVSGFAKNSPPKESLKQLDATEAYRARLATYRAQHGDAPPSSKAPTAQAAAETSTANSAPKAAKVSTTSAPEPDSAPATSPAVSPTTPAARLPAVRVIPAAESSAAPQPPQTGPNVRVRSFGSATAQSATAYGESRSERVPNLPNTVASTADDEPDFEVVDDIDDRAPDPTLYRGGRRVLLLTLLGIALLVLLALQLINA